MACTQTLTGIPASCDFNQGGIVVAYIANYSDVKTVSLDEVSNMIKTITMNTEAKFKTYNFKKGTGSMSSTLNVDPANGINFVQTDLVLQFAKMETAKRIEIAALAVGELAVIVKDANGKYWYLGYSEPVTATAGASQTGTARTDGNNYSITLTDYFETYPYEVDPEALTTVIEGAAA